MCIRDRDGMDFVAEEMTARAGDECALTADASEVLSEELTSAHVVQAFSELCMVTGGKLMEAKDGREELVSKLERIAQVPDVHSMTRELWALATEVLGEEEARRIVGRPLEP
eukprot:TRINITY_DN37307_c0_g1_i1.p1 TRINITY_DN37307_c0_g1~~TRINITY_DN37307_c0_g1_i1.p1  ORF type:complete len:119 (+),score=43.30 TRINITY_DN37307_c0_g1_i1:23-358(+)